MKTFLARRRPRIAALALPAVLALGGCTTGGFGGFGGFGEPEPPPAPAPAPEIPSSINPADLVGRWGLAAYHKADDRARTEAAARNQCRNPYVINRGPNGGVMMYIADDSKLSELRLKGGPGGKNYVGPPGESGQPQDREILSFDGRVMIARNVDPDAAGRYGTEVFVRCAPRA